MSKKCKFDSEWEMAISLLSKEEAAQARQIIENYQNSGIMPAGLSPMHEMILLLAKPLIDRRRRAAASARLRRQQKKAEIRNKPENETVSPIITSSEVNIPPTVKVTTLQSDIPVNKPSYIEFKKHQHKKHRKHRNRKYKQ